MKKVIIIDPPVNCWAKGYPVSKGDNDSSINMTTVYAKQNNIVANQDRLAKGFKDLKEMLKKLGYQVIVLPFPDDLKGNDGLHHDGVFVRDVGLMFRDKWIKSNFSAINRQPEAESYAKIMKSKFQKEVITLPKDAYLEFGEVYYLETSDGSYYFGGLSRANKKGHDFVRSQIKPDNYFLIKSKGYHLDTVFTPVLSQDNRLAALIVAKDMLEHESFEKLKKHIKVEMIVVNNKDSSDEDGMGNYAVNCLVGNGFLVGGAHFSTPGVEKKLKELNIDFHLVSLVDFNYSGGSVHCLTNEVY